LVRAEPDGSVTYVGRADDRFKLSNGRFVEGAKLSAALVRSVPGATEACVVPMHGDTIGVALVGRVPNRIDAPLAEALGAMRLRVKRVLRYAPSAAPRTAKGGLDTHAIAEAARAHMTSEKELFHVHQYAA
jgi:long-subunit acyl-CoA synthetase (AMP-forming)